MPSLSLYIQSAGPLEVTAEDSWTVIRDTDRRLRLALGQADAEQLRDDLTTALDVDDEPIDGTPTIDQLRVLSVRRARADAVLGAARTAEHDVIRKVLAAGVTAYAVAQATGYSTTYIYRIRDRRG